MELSANLAKNTRILMDYHNLTQTGLSKKAGVSQRTISNIVNADRVDGTNVTLGSIVKISAALKVFPWMMIAFELSKLNIDPRSVREINDVMNRYSKASTKDREIIDHILTRE